MSTDKKIEIPTAGNSHDSKMSSKKQENKAPKKERTLKQRIINCSIVTVLYLAFCYWVGSWWGLLVVPFIIDVYITKKIPWTWWRKTKNSKLRMVMSWVDAIVFALVAVYFLNQFFFQNYVIPSSSLEKSLLTGDYLLVSKLSYGPRIPQTPLYMPLTQHTMPVTGTKSYLEKPHWDYRRVKGFGKPELNDIVVFNYPSGDTVALNRQNMDYYRLCYEIGSQSATDTLRGDMSYDEQQAIFMKVYNMGKHFIAENPQEFGQVVSRPTDRRENYVKRCVGLPGQTLQIKDNKIYLDGKLNPDAENVQYAYDVLWKQFLDDDTKKELGISNEDLQYTSATAEGTATQHLPLTLKAKDELVNRGFISQITASAPESNWLYPQNKITRWSTANYGPLWIPKKGEKINLTLDNLPIYERCIRSYEGNKLEVKGGKIYINDKAATEYTFKLDYYWMMGDNRDCSADSRFWGFVPEDHIVGKPLFIWMSLDPDYGLFDGKIRWNRLFNWVGNMK